MKKFGTRLTALTLCLASFPVLHAQSLGAISAATAGATSTAAATVGSGSTAQAATQASGPQNSVQGLAEALAGLNNPAGTTGAEAGTAKPLATQAAAAPQAPTQFELFVQSTTGQRLPIYGNQLFAAPQTFAPLVNAAAPANYVLAPGDEVQLQVWGATSFNANLVVDKQGQVMIPRIGPLSLVGITAGQLSGVFKTHLGKMLTNVEVAAHVSKLRSIQVYVVGQARQPGTYTLSSLSTLVNALFASGGPSATGSMRNIQLKRAGKTLTTLDLYDFIAQGNAQADVALQAGDVIVIPPVGPRVAIAGAYDHAAIYELKAGHNQLQQVLAQGGGVPTLTAPQKALLERVVPTAQPPRQVADIALNAIGLATPLQDGDVVTLMGISPAFANAVTLQGNVAAPLRYPFSANMRVSDLIPELDALVTADYYTRKNLRVQNLEVTRKTVRERNSGQQGQCETVTDAVEQIRTSFDTINWDYALIERLDRKTLTNQLIPFNLGKAVLQHDPAHDLPLQPGDVLTVFNAKDLQLPTEKRLRLVRVEGEVATPGVYPLLPGETLPQLLRRVGGLTPQAYVFGLELTRESVRKQQQENLDKLVTRLEQSLDASSNAELTNASGAVASQAALAAQARKETLQKQIARLRNFRSNGRVALELPTEAQALAALPAVPLEDGDNVVVPAMPSFVGAFGSVSNENVLVYRPGRTVADVLRLAAPTADANVEQAFVVRADGTVVGHGSYSSWWFNNLNSLALMPGDTVVVPAKTQLTSNWDKTLGYAKDITQIFSNLGLGVAAIRSIQTN